MRNAQPHVLHRVAQHRIDHPAEGRCAGHGEEVAVVTAEIKVGPVGARLVQHAGDAGGPVHARTTGVQDAGVVQVALKLRAAIERRARVVVERAATTHQHIARDAAVVVHQGHAGHVDRRLALNGARVGDGGGGQRRDGKNGGA
ncbi:hypothetical protein D3C73_1068910 [compost metagenome]